MNHYADVFSGIPEENIFQYTKGGFHPVHINDRFKDGQYEILNKLGYGADAAVWAVQDHQDGRMVCVKILTAETSETSYELEVLKQIQAGKDTEHPSVQYLAQLLDYFYCNGANKQHLCLALELLGPSVWSLQNGSEDCRLDFPVSRRVCRQVLLATEYLHMIGFAHGGAEVVLYVLMVVQLLIKLNLHARNILFHLPTTPELSLNLSEVEIYQSSQKNGEPVGRHSEGIGEELAEYFVPTAKYRALCPPLSRAIVTIASPDSYVDDNVAEDIKQNFNIVYHGACTCAMGHEDDRIAVVDMEAKVFAVQGLQLIDTFHLCRLDIHRLLFVIKGEEFAQLQYNCICRKDGLRYY